MTRIAIVGAGAMGTVHYNCYRHIDDTEVAAVVGVTEKERARAEEWQLPLYDNIKEMLAEQDPDIVDICTPTFLHIAEILEALEAGKNVITEKPMALSLDDARRAFDRAEAVGVQIYVAQVLQFYKESEVLRGLVQSGEYGRPLDAAFSRLTARPKWAAGGWLFDRSKSGYIPFDLHIHDLDLIVSLFGKPSKFDVFTCGDLALPDLYNFVYEYPELRVKAEAGWLNAEIPFTATWRVYFERGLVVNEGGRVIAYPEEGAPREFDIEEKTKIPTGINIPPTGTYLAELAHFIDCYRRGIPSDRVTRRQVETVLEILEQVNCEQQIPITSR